jgi:hypothetical protein
MANMRKYERTFLIDVEAVPASPGEPAGYVATNGELGLVVEADTFDELVRKISEIAPILFDLNVLPKLKSSVQNIPPAFLIQHAIIGNSCARNALS